MKTRTLPLLAGVLGLLVLSAPARAQEEANQMVVVRDAETGLLRAPTAAELATLQSTRLKANAALRRGAATPLNLQVKRHASGAVGARATHELASYAVAGKRADGTLIEACFDSKRAADQAVQEGVLPVTPAQPQQQQAVEK